MIFAGGHEVLVALHEIVELGLFARREQRRNLVAKATQAECERKGTAQAVTVRIDVTAYGDAMCSVKQLNALRVIELRH